MYERSAIVLEKYFNGICGFDKKVNLKTVYKDYKEMVEEIQNYQTILQEEEIIIREFDEAANDIRIIQQEQKKLYKNNVKLEEERDQLFDNLDEDSSSIEKKLLKIEENLDKNNKRLAELREEFIKAVTKFTDKQKERNKYSRNRREQETTYVQVIERTQRNINQIDIPELKSLKQFANSEDEEEKEEIIEIMINNGKDERVEFDKNVIENAAKIRNEIAKKEADCYITIFEKARKLLSETNSNDDTKIDKYNKTLRDTGVKLAFLKALKMYIVSFLDNERMTSINGGKIHKQLMLDACEKFESDIQQFNNLYELILKEIAGKSSKKGYKELYNKEYLKNIEEKEKNFEQEINNIKIKTGTIINSNYWRIEEIKNIYEVFQKEVSEKFEKDLSEFKLEVLEEDEEIEENNSKTYQEEDSEDDDIFKKSISDDDDDEYEDDEDEEYEDDDEYEDDEEYDDDDEYEDDEDEEYDDDDEYEDDDDDEYEDDEDEEYEDDNEYEDDEDEEYEDDEEYDDDDDEYEDEDEEDDDDIEDTKSNSVDKKGKGIFNKFFKDKKN